MPESSTPQWGHFLVDLVTVPPHLPQVYTPYTVPSVPQLQQQKVAAEKVHGIHGDGHSFGFSFLERAASPFTAAT